LIPPAYVLKESTNSFDCEALHMQGPASSVELRNNRFREAPRAGLDWAFVGMFLICDYSHIEIIGQSTVGFAVCLFQFSRPDLIGKRSNPPSQMLPETQKPVSADHLRFLPTKEQGQFLQQFYRGTEGSQRRILRWRMANINANVCNEELRPDCIENGASRRLPKFIGHGPNPT
jgi:hypothetical protein